ncbi:MAG: hypothetical protein CL663_05580 [Bacteroidetes bacterium]|nr:hypothetical protein [Bacteroidota bacterium]|tara:strand:+ start:87 stop:767 length:681 start_codon:yes stop_codon:yes gene_type:complete
MKKILLLVVAALFAVSAFAQDYEEDEYKDKFDFGVDIFHDVWMGKPAGMDPGALNLGFSIFGMYEQHIWDSKNRFSLGMGGALTTHQLTSNMFIEDVTTAVIVFDTIPEGLEYSTSKLVVTYLDFPIEIRYKSKNDFRFALGAKVGFRFDSHTKYSGQRLDGSTVAKEIVKHKNVANIESIRFGPTMRIGYKWFNLSMYYSVTKMFLQNRGPALRHFSVGLTLNPY